MTTTEIIFYSIISIVCIAFVFVVFFGKPSKDEPLPPIEDHEIFWHK